MILVLLGTQNNSFHRLLEEVEKNIEDGTIKEEVIVQAGYTKYITHKMRIIDLMSQKQLNGIFWFIKSMKIRNKNRTIF